MVTKMPHTCGYVFQVLVLGMLLVKFLRRHIYIVTILDRGLGHGDERYITDFIRR